MRLAGPAEEEHRPMADKLLVELAQPAPDAAAAISQALADVGIPVARIDPSIDDDPRFLSVELGPAAPRDAALQVLRAHQLVSSVTPQPDSTP